MLCASFLIQSPIFGVYVLSITFHSVTWSWWRNFTCMLTTLPFTWLRLLLVRLLSWTSSFRSCMTDAALTAWSYPTPVSPTNMILMRGQFVGPLQAVSLGNSVVNQVKVFRRRTWLNWNVYVKELIKSFSQKLNLLRSLHFLPTTARADFYFKVILPSVTYGLVV